MLQLLTAWPLIKTMGMVEVAASAAGVVVSLVTIALGLSTHYTYAANPNRWAEGPRASQAQTARRMLQKHKGGRTEKVVLRPLPPLPSRP